MNVAIEVEMIPGKDVYLVKGRGEFQLGILIEQMRREGYEFSVGRPTVLFKMVGKEKHEPIEHLYVDVASEYQGIVVEKL